MNDILYTVPNRDKFFEETSKHYKDILEEFKSTDLFTMEFVWDATPIYDILNIMGNNISSFKSIKGNIDSITDYTIMTIGIAVIKPGVDRYPHIDPHSKIKGFKRYHLPLQLTDTSFLYVKEHNKGTEYKKCEWELGKWMLYDRIDLMHYPDNKDENGIPRIMIILDVVEGTPSNVEIKEYYHLTEYTKMFPNYHDKISSLL